MTRQFGRFLMSLQNRILGSDPYLSCSPKLKLAFLAEILLLF